MNKGYQYIYNDGGRSEAGYKGRTSDCVTRAISIITQKPYKDVYKELKKRTKNSKCSPHIGISRYIYDKYIKSLGMQWKSTYVEKVGYPIRLNGELPKGRIICSVREHLTAVIDGVIYDEFDPVEDKRSVVYGYYY